MSSSFDNGSSADAVAGLAKGLPVNIQMSSALIMLLVHSCVTEHPFIGGLLSFSFCLNSFDFFFLASHPCTH